MATTPNGGSGMKLPLIGITTGYAWHGESVVELAKRYVDAVARVGGVPVTLAPTEDPNLIAQYVERLDGLIISGGKDIPPPLYGEQAIPETDALPEDRPLFEIALVRRFREMDKPVLGICYGCQLLNVAFGGTLIQDIPSQVGSSVKHRRTSSAEAHARHVVTVRNGSRLREILGVSEVEIVSSHHQAVKRPAPGFRVTADAPDGVIETIEMEDARFFVGLQWHPEMDPEAEATRRLMQAFVQAASHNKC
ncbi:MAG: gamma-glutamyl-gamma-aminobutyrate hydrolase family protein [Armatimonadota bacterium]